MQDFGKLLFAIGAIIMVAGLVLWKTGGFGPLGKLPGDISVTRDNFSFHFPLMTCILLSIVFTFLMWLLRK